MSVNSITLPFIVKTQGEKESLTYAAEVAYMTCMAEMQRKKASFLRDTPEKLVLLSKLYYPLWVVPVENHSVVLDGLGALAYKFSFKEPARVGQFIEELKRNRVNPDRFMDVLERHAGKIGELESQVTVEFKGLIADRELLALLLDYFKLGQPLTEGGLSKALVPIEVDEDGAVRAGKNVINCLRTIRADVKSVEYALSVLKEAVAFHKNAANMEAELLKEKCESEVASVKPEVDKKIKKLIQKRDRALACVQHSADKKVATLERKREQYMRRLQSAEKRKEAAERRREKLREKKTSRSALGTYEVEKCEREIGSIKKEVRAIDDAIDKIKKETAQGIKNLEEEHRRAIAQEEAKIAQIVAAYQEKIGAKQRRIEEITKQTAVLTTRLDNVIDELKQNGDVLRRQVEVDYRLDDPEKPTLVLLPVYLIKYLKEKDERFALFSPMVVSEEGGVLSELRKIITFNSDPKIKGLTRPISRRLHDVLTVNLTGRMQVDGEFKSKINTLGRNNNLVDTDEFSEILNVGLDELVERNLMTAEETKDMCKRIVGEGA